MPEHCALGIFPDRLVLFFRAADRPLPERCAQFPLTPTNVFFFQGRESGK